MDETTTRTEDEKREDRLVEAIAVACHQQNRAWCLSIGDDSQPLWLDAPKWQTDSAIDGVRKALKNPSPSASHESWLAHKTAAGWVYGEKKDPDASPPTHPCMVPYDQLPPEQKRKDHLFIDMVVQLGTYLGLIETNAKDPK